MRVAFVAPKAYPVLAGASPRGSLGGAEVQQARLARALAARGLDVTMVARLDDDAPDRIDAIRLINLPRVDGWPGFRFAARWRALHKAILAADCDVYYQRGAGCETGQVAAACRAIGRTFVFAVSSDSDCTADLLDLHSWRERLLYRRGLSAAQAVIAQTEAQAQRLAADFRIQAVVIPSAAPTATNDLTPAQAESNPTPRRPNDASNRPTHPAQPTILWIGRFSPEKRPEWVLELAHLRPAWRFRLVGAQNRSTPYASRFLADVARYPNVELPGIVPQPEMPGLYRDADVLLCTSRWEGFPNTFLEAWSYGTPVVSTVDPARLLTQHGIGLTGESPDQLAARVDEIFTDRAAHDAMIRRAREYVTTRHSLDVVADRLIDLLRAAHRGRTERGAAPYAGSLAPGVRP